MATVPEEVFEDVLPNVFGLISCSVHNEPAEQRRPFLTGLSSVDTAAMLLIMASMLAGEMEHSAQHHGTDPATELQALIIKINNRSSEENWT